MSESPDTNPYDSPRAGTNPNVTSGGDTHPGHMDEQERSRRKRRIIAIGYFVAPVAFAIAFATCCTGALVVLYPFHWWPFDPELTLVVTGLFGGVLSATAVVLMFKRWTKRIDAE